jgi:radical SAM-linked protein
MEEGLPWDQIALGLSTSGITDVLPEPRVEGDMALPEPRIGEAEAPPSNGIEISRPAAAWKRLVFSFKKTGAAVFISHLDLMTVFERAIMRAGYAARFTEGFNPKPRLEFANPLSLGLESMEEIAGVDLHDYDSEESCIARLNRSLPTGLALLRAAVVPHDGVSRRRSLMSLYWGADFELLGMAGDMRTLRLPAAGASIRKTLEAEGTWQTTKARRLATWASGPAGERVSYFEALCPDPSDAGDSSARASLRDSSSLT